MDIPCLSERLFQWTLSQCLQAGCWWGISLLHYVLFLVLLFCFGFKKFVVLSSEQRSCTHHSLQLSHLKLWSSFKRSSSCVQPSLHVRLRTRVSHTCTKRKLCTQQGNSRAMEKHCKFIRNVFLDRSTSWWDINKREQSREVKLKLIPLPINFTLESIYIHRS